MNGAPDFWRRRRSCGGDGEQGEVEEAPGEVAHAEDVHGGDFDEVGAGHVHVAELAVGRPAALDEEADVVDEGGVADQRPAPAPEEVEERGDGEAGGEGDAEEAGGARRADRAAHVDAASFYVVGSERGEEVDGGAEDDRRCAGCRPWWGW